MSTFSYVKHFVKDKYIASITPTSEFGVRHVCSKIDFRNCRVLVEYGPGTGVFTRYLLSRMGPDTRILLIERNPGFVRMLTKRFTDPRVIIRNVCASTVLETLEDCGIQAADAILSGIPFSFLPYETRMEIVKKTHAALRERGKFLAYQTFYQSNLHLKEPLRTVFGSVRVEYEMLNIPPMRIYEAVK
ncbi:MAG: rRNA adenine N-6-methyltransferase family protein [Deltaproteobacteria bacterium]